MNARTRWEQAFAASPEAHKRSVNRSGIEVKPLYTPDDVRRGYAEALGFPGEYPYARGIYASMHRGRSWTQRQLIGLGTPEDYNARLKHLLEKGATAISLIPCNSVYRGYDADEVAVELLGTCGVVVNSVDDMQRALDGVPIERISCGLNDPTPFTLLALLLAVAHRRGIPSAAITGTSNQSDCLSHFVANHMFFRLALPGARRLLTDHIAYCNQRLPGWNPLSVVGQHMQQAGATPAEAMAFTLCSAIQYAEDCRARGMDPDAFLPRFTFFFDISISFFEEIAKFRAGRRVWARIARERLGAKNPACWRMKFHAQTSGADLTRQQPLNNIARVAVQAMAGIFGGLQSLHTDSFDEAFSTPTVEGARIAVVTQNILRDEAHLADVIDPLGGSYYVEALTDEMEARIKALIAKIDAAGGMYRAVEAGLVQRMIGDSALAFQRSIESGEQVVAGVNAYQVEEKPEDYRVLELPERKSIEAHIARLAKYKRERPAAAVRAGLDALAAAAQSEKENIFRRVVEAADAGATHGEICACLRRELGFGQPLCIV
ncbi:MAG TPA: acyl-CoA mutase large subunit family protein [Burkholderiales bacterium]|nr:acyl-CoA mutase large subunit family protein [Burkholderiales bacterium]